MQNSKSEKSCPAITFKNVGVFYKKQSGSLISSLFRKPKGFWALKDLSFEIEKGQVLGIIGNNGAGKSTSLLVISQVIKPDKGSINIYNNTVSLLTINAGLMKTLNGRKNIMLLGLALGIKKEVIQEKLQDIIDFSELGNFIDEPVEVYSSGMRSRLGFSTALMLNPDILLVDEVLGVGDKNFKKKSKEALREKIKANNTTAIITSHSKETILDLCDKVLWIEQGVGKAFGDAHEVMEMYENEN